MTIMDALYRIDELKPNVFSQEQKIKWLSSLDGVVKAEIIDTHDEPAVTEFDGYDANQALDTKLLIDYPYDDVYINWLETQIDYANGDYKRYNNSVDVFNDAFSRFKKHYNKTHLPKKTRLTNF